LNYAEVFPVTKRDIRRSISKIS